MADYYVIEKPLCHPVRYQGVVKGVGVVAERASKQEALVAAAGEFYKQAMGQDR